MKKALFVLLFIFTFTAIITPYAGVATAVVHVKGYTTKKGKYVKPYIKSNSNKSKLDNYSTKGNKNPYTGKKGTKKIK